jgi:hypothetical protein
MLIERDREYSCSQINTEIDDGPAFLRRNLAMEIIERL